MPLIVYKEQGETPLERVLRLKQTHPSYADKTVSYAGRLDPMAEGLLLLLIGDENKKRHDYERYEKTYEFDVLYGIETDSYDVLGIPQSLSTQIPETLHADLQAYATTHAGTHEQSYPPYSSKPVRGKPLYYWARHHKLAEISIPTKQVTLSSFVLRSVSSIKTASLEEMIIRSIGTVSGNFRQDEILSAWQKLFTTAHIHELTTASFTLTCSSGTYIRSIVHDMGQYLGCGAIALRIKRIQIGPYTHPTIDE